MAQVAKSGTPSLASILIPANNKITGLVAGEAIAVFDACYIKSDGKVWKSIGTAVNAAAKVDGFAATAAAVGEAVTLLFDVVVRYGAGMTPGTRLFLSSVTAGTLGDAASVGGTAPVGFVVDATRVFLSQSEY